MSTDEEDTRSVELRTYTSLWQVEKRIYKVYDFALPMPVSLRMLGIIAVTVIPWVTLLALLQVPFDIQSPWWIMWIAPPIAIAYFANRPIAEGKTLFDLLISQSTYFLGQPTYFASMKPWNQPADYHVAAYTWNSDRSPTEETADGSQEAPTSREHKKKNTASKPNRTRNPLTRR